MSVICAIFSNDGVCEDELQSVLGSLRAYPNDAEGVWRSGRMALCACTLHTTSESLDQPQPLASEDGRLACVFDGYLTNFEELVGDLECRGVALRMRSDAELALQAYEIWGEDCADRLHGEFALIVADQRAGRLFAACDHMGLVPLYIFQEGGRLVISSDFRIIEALKPKVLEPNLRYLAQTISNRWFLRDETPWKQIRRLKRAHFVSFDGASIREGQYWVPPTKVSIRYKSDEEYAEHYRELLFDCVQRASRSLQKVGVAVSGGLDSSAIFAVANRLEHDGQWLAPGFHGYSLAAEAGSNAFELPYARATAEYVGRDISEVPLFDPDIDTYIKDALWHEDLATPSNCMMMQTLQQKVVADGSRVLIDGTGGDEWLQGTAHCYAEFLEAKDIRGFLEVFGDEASARGFGSAFQQSVRQIGAWAAPKPFLDRVRALSRERRRVADVAMNWLAPELQDALKDAEETYHASLPTDPVQASKVHLAQTPRSDMSRSMTRRQRNRLGIESRHPMLSRPFIEFSCATPAHTKRRGALSKVTHRNAMAPYLPEKVLNRATKANFTNTKIDHQFAEYARKHASRALRDICDLEGLSQVLDIDFLGPDGDYWAWEIWGLYASAAFLYQANRKYEINPASGVQMDREKQ